MSGKIVLHTNPMSRGRIARWMLEEAGAPYDVKRYAFGPEMKGPAFLALNPLGKVPVLEHGDAVVSECAAICAYLADAFPEAGLAPPPSARALYYRWLAFGPGPLEAALVDRAFDRAPPEDKQAMSHYGAYDRVLDALEQGLAGRDYIASDRFSAADLLIGAQLEWGLSFGTIEERSGFRAYVARVTDRPARRRAQALDDADMASMKGESGG